MILSEWSASYFVVEVLLFLVPCGVLGHFVMSFFISPSFLGCYVSHRIFFCNQTLSEEAVEG